MEILLLFFLLGILVFLLACVWIVFTKAGEPGWAVLVPIYNAMVLARVGGKSEAYGLLTLIPILGIVFSIIILIGVAERFNRGAGFAVGLIFLPFVFWPILAFTAEDESGRRRKKKKKKRRFEEEEEEEWSSRRRRDEEDEEEAPRRRRRPPDDDDDPPPRARPRPRDENVSERPPKRRSRDDDEEEPPRRRRRPADDEDE